MPTLVSCQTTTTINENKIPSYLSYSQIWLDPPMDVWMGANVITPLLHHKNEKQKTLVGRCNCKQSNKKYSTIIM
jgi:hypothetical protein